MTGCILTAGSVRDIRSRLLPSSDYDELERALRLLRVIPMMQQTRILLFPPARGTAPARSPEEVKKRLGADVVAVDEKTFSDLIAGADEEAVQAEAATLDQRGESDHRTQRGGHHEGRPRQRRPAET